MSRDELLNKIAVLANRDAGSLKGPERLEDLEDWDSLAVLSVISLLDEQFHVVVPAATLHEAQTIDDIVNLVGDKLSS
jgi:acyl carrier protein